MTIEEMAAEFERLADLPSGGPDFDPKTARHPVKDIAALLLLSELDSTPHFAAISAAEHDEIFFAHDAYKVAECITLAEIAELDLYGVFFDEGLECFKKFV